MKTEFAPYDIALAMKELGFNEKCLAFYTDDKYLFINKNLEVFPNLLNKSKINAPLYQQAFRWFRENYYGLVSIRNELHKPLEILSNQTEKDACLRKLIEIVKEKDYENN